MRLSGLSRLALSSCVALAMLASCGVPPFGSAQGRLAQDDMRPPIASASIGGPCIYLLSTNEASDLSNSQIKRSGRCFPRRHQPQGPP